MNNIFEYNGSINLLYKETFKYRTQSVAALVSTI
jgi:hypothetical protein